MRNCLATWVVATCVLVAAALTYAPLFRSKGAAFSPHQPVTQMQAEYRKCKASAPEGFDCYMQPVMVSEPFIIEEVKK